MSEPIDAMLGRLGYVRRDLAGQEIEIPSSEAGGDIEVIGPVYPQVVMIQGRSTGESWVRDHAGQLLLAAGIGVFALTALAVVALVAVLVTVALVTCSVGLVAAAAIARSAAGASRRGGRR